MSAQPRNTKDEVLKNKCDNCGWYLDGTEV